MAKKRAPARAKKTAKPKRNPDSFAFLQLGKDVWPLERDVLFRPDRLKYVRKLIPKDGCVFCRAASEEMSEDTLCIYKSSHSMIVLNKYPYNSGHVLVLPLRHKASLLDLSENEFHDLHKTKRMALDALLKVYQPAAVNLGMNHGQVSGAGIPDHLHYHLVPRWAGDLNFFPLIAETKVVVETLEQSYSRLRDFFQDIQARKK